MHSGQIRWRYLNAPSVVACWTGSWLHKMLCWWRMCSMAFMMSCWGLCCYGCVGSLECVPDYVECLPSMENALSCLVKALLGAWQTIMHMSLRMKTSEAIMWRLMICWHPFGPMNEWACPLIVWCLIISL